jgi:DNA-binding NarL/FixJ family response regulator
VRSGAARENHGVAQVRSVLIVDDHPGFRAMARRRLRDAGFEVVGEAADGAGAMAAAHRLEPDVVLLDIQLPDIDGFEVTRRLLAASAEAAIVLVSSREESDYGDRIARSPAAGFMAKEQLSGSRLRALLEAAR